MPNNPYIQYEFKISPPQPATEILIAELGEAGFESFVETESGLLAYIQKNEWNENILRSIQILSNPDFKIEYLLKQIEQENWNATWEQSFDPIQVGDQCVVRAPFHDPHEVKYDIIITPKMSFGTGHHETTFMMLKHILMNEFEEKSVLDMGSGTGVLAILAAMKGAKHIDAIDVDHWCYANAIENIEINRQGHIMVHQGDASVLENNLKGRQYDIILANINRNILLKDIPTYSKHLKKNGLLFLSGFYRKDLPSIAKTCAATGLYFQEKLEKNNWVAAVYRFS